MPQKGIPKSLQTSDVVPLPEKISDTDFAPYRYIKAAGIQPEKFPRYEESPHSLLRLGA